MMLLQLAQPHVLFILLYFVLRRMYVCRDKGPCPLPVFCSPQSFTIEFPISLSLRLFLSLTHSPSRPLIFFLGWLPLPVAHCISAPSLSCPFSFSIAHSLIKSIFRFNCHEHIDPTHPFFSPLFLSFLFSYLFYLPQPTLSLFLSFFPSFPFYCLCNTFVQPWPQQQRHQHPPLHQSPHQPIAGPSTIPRRRHQDHSAADRHHPRSHISLPSPHMITSFSKNGHGRIEQCWRPRARRCAVSCLAFR
ncbi:hypothetical protein K457DRAFT_185923 [Linnemannia elongata AG-77]|uniref:Uncharacterized protein n=1 Tax=Linnemannia elongata AG-77 TaxID=1314771 RepID=A0A197KBZ6_9FUNG|nr:hypothetical protein K457DRAFT_185923 [Linnemannia elongata AG-77]